MRYVCFLRQTFLFPASLAKMSYRTVEAGGWSVVGARLNLRQANAEPGDGAVILPPREDFDGVQNLPGYVIIRQSSTPFMRLNNSSHLRNLITLCLNLHKIAPHI